MPTPTPPAITCANCGESARGRYCSNCGAPLQGATCSTCQAELVAGAKFCHRCGAPAGAGAAAATRATAVKGAAPKPAASKPAPPAAASPVGSTPSPAAAGLAAAAPWAVGGIALVALVAMVATYRFRGSEALSGTAPSEPMSGAGGGGGATAVDISSMSPRERAERLFNRIMRLDGEGKKDSVQFFAPMAMSAYQMIPDQDVDTRYDAGRIAEVAGALPAAKAQADTILKASPTNLLGLVLAMRVAREMGNTKGAAAYGARLREANASERKKNNPEYQLHTPDIDHALTEIQP